MFCYNHFVHSILTGFGYAARDTLFLAHFSALSVCPSAHEDGTGWDGRVRREEDLILATAETRLATFSTCCFGGIEDRWFLKAKEVFGD